MCNNVLTLSRVEFEGNLKMKVQVWALLFLALIYQEGNYDDFFENFILFGQFI